MCRKTNGPRSFVRGPSFCKTFGELRRMESLGDWRSSGVLLHQPLVKKAIPEKLVPQSELICRRLSCCISGRLANRLSLHWNYKIALSDILAFGSSRTWFCATKINQEFGWSCLAATSVT